MMWRPDRILPALTGGALALLALSGAVAPGQDTKPAPPSPEAARFFETRVRPVLADNCFKCHGDKKQRGELRLDSLAAMLAGGDQGPAIVRGDPEKSLLVKAIRHTDADLKMPPTKKLAREQVDDLTAWIKRGAPWPGADLTATTPTRKKGEMQVTDRDRAHWAFQPVKQPAVPRTKNTTWAANPIDAFILAGLEARGLQPNPPAAKQELVRRLYYDVTGLPPTPRDVEAFLADPSPRAYENLVERLLDSPHYGEKWGRHWLDLVRYAETNSYERDNPKPNVWRYRDYVIRAFNQDKPYDRFLREQLAGDELPDRDADALIATGYYRLGIWDDEPSDRLQARYDGLDDILATTGQVFLGLTLDCARCHDHKIDPIPQKDYYRFLAFFHNINPYRNGGPTDEVPIYTAEAARKGYAQRVRELDARRNQLQADLAVLETEFRSRYEKGSGAKVTQPDMDDLRYRYYRDTWDRLPNFSVLKAEDSGPLPRQLFDLSPRTRNTAFGFVFEGVLVVPQPGPYTFYLDSDDGSRLTVAGQRVLEYDRIHGLGNEQQATVDLPRGRLPIKLEYFQKHNGLGLEVAWSGPGFVRRSLSAPEGKAVARKDVGKLILTEGARVLGPEQAQRYRRLKKDLERLKKASIPGELALCVTEAGRQAPETFVLVRGNPQARGAKVEPGFPVVLGENSPVIPTPPPMATTSRRRTVLADWLTSPDNQLTARVMANRIWQYHFGRGIVRTPNDFGTQGARPTHPELLDWLAREFVAGGWRLKALHRLILTSQAYRMSSRGNPQALAVDPANERFWRFDMRRLSAEEIRDSILAVSGNLNLKMYGPSIYPEIPKAVLAGQSVPGRGWTQSPLDEQNRRSVYVHVKRSLLLPILESFDLAEPDRTTPVRFSTTQPTQALGMLNGAFLNQQAEVFAGRLRREAGASRAAQVRLAFSLATGHAPTPDDVRRGTALMDALQNQDGASADMALRYFCLMVLNLNELIYLD
jgi:mono/diheme cytochrome c family protein